VALARQPDVIRIRDCQKKKAIAWVEYGTQSVILRFLAFGDDQPPQDMYSSSSLITYCEQQHSDGRNTAADTDQA
jgi:hypothetical protein